MKKYVILIILIFSQLFMFGQNVKKSVPALPISSSIKIDGILDEPVWSSAAPATDFIQRIPFNGKPATFRNEVRFLYDNTGLYIGAIMYDPYPDSIPMQLGLRDSEDLNADYLLIMLSPFNDGLNAFCFQVWISDVQSDFKIPGSDGEGEDLSWDAVWQSKAKKDSVGWIAEIKIPYSALRFPDKSIQEWGINCQREIRRYREVSTWNFVDSKVQGFVNQGGLLEGIKGIKPPLRL